MDRLKNIFTPKQPFFVMSSAHYYKYVVMEYGISHFYSFVPSMNIDNMVAIVPDGCIDIIFRCGVNKPDAYIYGTVLKYGTSKFIKGDYYFGVRFLPGKALLPGNLSISELIDEGISLYDVMKDKKMIEDITSSKDFKYQIQTFMNAYLKDFYSMNKSIIRDLREYLIDEMLRTKGNIRIEDLSQETGYSSRYIGKVFSNEFGMPPKTFCRFMRFQNLLNNLNAKEEYENITQIAMECGYFDQSHLVKDFHAFTNLTPKKYLKEMEKNSYKNRIIIL